MGIMSMAIAIAILSIASSAKELPADRGLQVESSTDMGLELGPLADRSLEVEPTADIDLEVVPPVLGLEVEPPADLGFEGEPPADIGLQANKINLCKLSPSPIQSIAPVLQAFKKNTSPITFNYETTPSDVVKILDKNKYLRTEVVFIVHGFRNDLNERWMREMKDGILKESDKTVILVGWGKGANLFYYPTAASNTQAVGEWLATYAKELKYNYKDPNKVNIWGIGHSLGAHLLGKAGRDSRVFDRITGLDPAGPCFERYNHDKRLSRNAANFVDVIHTDGYRHLKALHYGTLIPLGTIDFYPNFGHNQPSCFWKVACSHSRAIELFTWSIANQHKFKTNRVLTRAPIFEKPVHTHRRGHYAEMGYYADYRWRTGNYYLPAKAKAPFA